MNSSLILDFRIIMNELDNIIRDYLQATDTDYAIMINGDWGCGKSYYIKHDFQDVVMSVDCPVRDEKSLISNWDKCNEVAREVWNTVKSKFNQEEVSYEESKYSPFYISLYGVSSVEDFNSRVNEEFFGLLGKGGKIFSSFIEGQFNVHLPFNAAKLIPHNAVLVFDDLERICIDKISPIEVLGLINTYSEHNHFKVVIVCNEDAFRQKAEDGSVQLKLDAEYKQYKEKTVRFTYTCRADVAEVYGKFADKYQDDYGAFLKEMSEGILDLFGRGGKGNIRTLKFFIDVFEKICNTAYPILEGDYCDQILDKLLCSTLIYVMEYKSGYNKEELLKLSEPLALVIDEDSGTAEELFVPEEVKKSNDADAYDVAIVQRRYLSAYDTMVRLPWLIDYITSGALNREEVEEFVRSQEEEFKRIETSPAVQALEKIKNLKKIDDEEAEPIVQLVWEYIKQNQYTVTELLDIYSLFITYVADGLKFVDLGVEKDAIFEKALRESPGVQDYKLDGDTRVALRKRSHETNEYQKRYYKLVEYVIDLQKEKTHSNYAQKMEAFLKAAEEEGSAVEGIATYQTNEDLRFSLCEIDWERVFQAIINASNPKACVIMDVVESMIVRDQSIWMQDEQSALNQFLGKLKEYRKNNRGKIRAYEMKGLVQTLQEFLKEKEHTTVIDLGNKKS